MREEIRHYNIKAIQLALTQNKKCKTQGGRSLMVAIKDDSGNLITDREKIVQRCAEFYKKLYSSTMARPATMDTLDDPVPHVTCSEIENALKFMSRGKAPGPDGIVIEIIQDGGSELWKRLAALFTKCIKSKTIPQEWNDGTIILLHKKGNIKDINNYRPISLISHTGKLLSKVSLTDWKQHWISTKQESRLDSEKDSQPWTTSK